MQTYTGAAELCDAIRNVPDFPKPGIQFKDITPVLASSNLFAGSIALLTQNVPPGSIDAVVGIDARGFAVAIVPHTLAVTTLGQWQAGRAVNLEVDLVARYVARLMGFGGATAETLPGVPTEPTGLSVDALVEAGYQHGE